ncbi:MAG: beta-ketoacyl-[acyl-carrier-protein] synthase family protein [Planctomycetota bacterium]
MRRTLSDRRVVITGMGINTPLGDNHDAFYDGLLAGKSAVRRWQCVATDGIYSKVGGDLTGYDFSAKLDVLKLQLPDDVFARLRRLVRKAPFSTKLSMLCAADALVDAGLIGRASPAFDASRLAIIVAGHNLNKHYHDQLRNQFDEEPDYLEPLASLLSLDTDHAGSIGEVFGVRGAIYTIGGACASGNIALRNALDEIRHHDYDVVLLVGAALEYAAVDLHAMALMGAISIHRFNDAPECASRPFDANREGFVPAHGAAALVIEHLAHALDRGARVHAEVLHVTALSDGCHLPQPSADGQARTMTRLLAAAGVAPEEIDYVSAHATSTPLGDLTEIDSLKRVFGAHAKRLKINAPKSMLGHTCWSAPTVETVAAILQMNRGTLHGSINIDTLDSRVDLDVCASGPVRHEVRTFLKDSFGFGGINCCSLFSRFESGGARR